MDIDAIIFDMDGVITDTEDIHMKAERDVCTDFGIECPIEEWKNFKGMTTIAIYRTIIDKYGQSSMDAEELAQRKVDRYLEIASDRIQPIDGAVDFIREMHARGFPLALTTSSVRPIADLVLQKFVLTPFFSVITTGDEVKNGKPDPEPYTLTLSRLELPGSRCAVIEDSDNGIRSAKSAGCLPIGITTSFPMDYLMEAGAEIVVDTFPQLSAQIRSRK